MKNTIKLVLFTFVIILGSACKKDFKETQKKIIFLTKPVGWKATKVEIKANATTWLDITSSVSPLDADNILTFYPTYEWKEDEGPTKKPENAQIAGYGLWKFLENDKKIQLEEGDLIEINELNDHQMITIVSKGPSTFRYTYKHP